ncbi:MAG: hypothetical protein JWP49_2787 [Phenylobacterium sp.]|nr:hypothetical protein [Phenylobacterium sp.]
MRRLAAICAVLGLAGGCAPTPLEATRTTPATPPPAAARRPMTPLPASKDACGAAELQGLVGHPRTDIPVPVDPNRQRVACTTCPVTQDYRPDRLNFFFDALSGRIREIKCG